MKFLGLVTNMIMTIDSEELKDFYVKLFFQCYQFSAFIPFPLFYSFLFLSLFVSGPLKKILGPLVPWSAIFSTPVGTGICFYQFSLIATTDATKKTVLIPVIS